MSSVSAYAAKQAGAQARGLAGDQRPLLDPVRLGLTQCGCGVPDGDREVYVCPTCKRRLTALAKGRVP